MKRNMWIWIVSAVVYLVIVIAGYSIYASVNPAADTEVEQEEESLK